MSQLAAPTYLSISAYSRTYGLSRKSVYKLLSAGELETWRTRGAVKAIRIRNIAPSDHQPAAISPSPTPRPAR